MRQGNSSFLFEVGDEVAPADTGSPDYPAKRFHNPPAMGEVRRKNLVMVN